MLRQRRLELGMTQAELGAAAGVDRRQINRYEAGQAQPVLRLAVALADALRLSIGELAGFPSQTLDLGGPWWAAWQTSKEHKPVVVTQEVNCHHDRDIIQVHALSRGLPVADGGYLWNGELRLWDQEVLTGWYAATDGATRSKGTLYYVLHPHGQQLTGRWVGLSYDSDCESGWAAMARTSDDAQHLIAALKHPRSRARLLHPTPAPVP